MACRDVVVDLEAAKLTRRLLHIMGKQYAPKTFIRQVRGALINRCLHRHKVETDLDVEIIKPAVVDELYNRLMAIPLDRLRLIERDFSIITDMATREGAESLLAQAQQAGADFSHEFGSARNDYERSCWAFLEHREIFETAACFHEMDRIGSRRWRKRFVGRDLKVSCRPEAIAELQSMMCTSFAKQGRGRRCHIDYYVRQEPFRHCFFAYPEDHPTSDLGYDEDGELAYQPRKTAFEIIFAYRPEDGFLEIMAPGGKDQIDDLTACFCAAILGIPEPPSNPSRRVFNLDCIKRPGMTFPTDPADGVLLVQLREVRLTLPKRNGWRRKIVFSTDPKVYDAASVHQMIVETIRVSEVPLDDIAVSHVKFRMLFALPDQRKPRPVDFVVSMPDHCDLRDGYYDQIARKYLRRWGIIVDEPTPQAASGFGSAKRAGLSG